MNTHDDAIVAEWLRRICGNEGGFQADPNDRGNWTGGQQGKGLLLGTKWGISAAQYPGLNIKALTVERACEIYTRDYLLPLQSGQFDDGVAYQLLDGAVHSGIPAATRMVQRAAGVADDGDIGAVTRSALAQRSESDLIMLFLGERLDFLSRLSGWPRYGAGWARRIAKNLRYGAEDSE